MMLALGPVVSQPAPLSGLGFEALATAGAFGCFGLSRREALWAAGAAAGVTDGHLPGTAIGMTAPSLQEMTPAEVTFADMWATATYGSVHPIEHIRPMLAEHGVLPAADLTGAPTAPLSASAGWSPTGSNRGPRAAWPS
jgi:error-prone DNA polymerase